MRDVVVFCSGSLVRIPAVMRQLVYRITADLFRSLHRLHFMTISAIDHYGRCIVDCMLNNVMFPVHILR